MNRSPQGEIEEIEEEYNYVDAPAWTVDKVAAPPDQRSLFFTQSFPPIAVCWLILLVIMGLRIHFTSVNSESNAKLTAVNQQLETLTQHLNLTLLAAHGNLGRYCNNLTVQFDLLTQNYTVLESKIKDLTAVNQQLVTQRNNLTEQIQNMETNWNKLNVSRAQWSIDAYCPKTNNVQLCRACQEGWRLNQTSCYVVHDAVSTSGHNTWEEAREVCRRESSDFVTVHNQEEQYALNYYSWYSTLTIGYWIGLRAEGGRWKWIDGSNLTVSYWTQQPHPFPGQCVMSVQNVGWRSVSCNKRKRWICKKKALSV
ncbi:C-type lectin domain family 10 member A-like [Sander lucioperca]|uniref:C-type lectin domain family 10 member A-like n=1 Tax=Sander lucioperca TaxID=283035 RepID=UPI00125D2C08|nr:C-type lectin domain family 10 member A-like [Sander lucioperca]XP_035861931.1 C-type lectin domain family 10 member A-like [Sander lucioperca]